MKIQRFQEISNHRIFKNFTWGNIPDFTRYNLIYGWNGTGKSTLSHIYQSIAEKDVITEGTVRVRVDGQIHELSIPGNQSLPNVRVFNSELVTRSIFESGDLEPIYYLGERSAEAQVKIEELQSQKEENGKSLSEARRRARDANNQIDKIFQEQARVIKDALRQQGTGKYNNYNKSDFQRKIETIIKSEENFELREEDYNQKFDSLKISEIQEITPPTFPSFDAAGLISSLKDALSTTVVSETIDELTENPAASRWVQQGISLHEHEDDCLFCGNNLTEVRKERLRLHFNDNFEKLQRELGNISSNIKATAELFESSSLPDAGRLEPTLRDSYDDALSVYQTARNNFTETVRQLESEVEAKRSSPFEPRHLEDSSEISLVSAVDKAKEEFAKLSALINKHNEASENLETSKEKARREIESHIVSRSIDTVRGLKETATTNQVLATELTQKSREFDTEIGIQRREIEQHKQPADELTAEVAAYLGRKELVFSVKEDGYEILRGDEKAVNLSEGEKTAIAFIYFLKTLQDSSFDMKSSVVVIDDPISSLDSNSLFSAFSFMADRTQSANQLFILTHNFQFFRLAKEWMEQLKRKNKDNGCAQFYMLKNYFTGEERASKIDRLDKLIAQNASEYHYLFSLVMRYSEGEQNDDELFVMPNVARRLLEAFYAYRNPVPGELREKISPDFDTVKRLRVLKYANHLSHAKIVGTDAENDFSFIREAQDFLKDVLDLIEHEDKNHYDAMVKLAS